MSGPYPALSAVSPDLEGLIFRDYYSVSDGSNALARGKFGGRRVMHPNRLEGRGGRSRGGAGAGGGGSYSGSNYDMWSYQVGVQLDVYLQDPV